MAAVSYHGIVSRKWHLVRLAGFELGAGTDKVLRDETPVRLLARRCSSRL